MWEGMYHALQEEATRGSRDWKGVERFLQSYAVLRRSPHHFVFSEDYVLGTSIKPWRPC